ncbi:MAG TPA: thymidine kinase [Myxococcales bacterium]|nr:thymidine kinase [Myxococcales bacterium]
MGGLEVICGPMFSGKTEEPIRRLKRAVIARRKVQVFKPRIDLGPEIVPVVKQLADRGLRVVVAGLDQDYRGVPFEPMPQLLAEAEYITKELAICVVCGAPANRSQRIVESDATVHAGSHESYEARCRKDFSPEPQQRTEVMHQELLPFLR